MVLTITNLYKINLKDTLRNNKALHIVNSSIPCLKKYSFEKISQVYLATFKILDYAVCDVTNPNVSQGTQKL